MRGSGYTLVLTSTDANLVLTKSASREMSETFKATTSRLKQQKGFTRIVLRTSFVGADPGSRVVGQDELQGKVNYFLSAGLLMP